MLQPNLFLQSTSQANFLPLCSLPQSNQRAACQPDGLLCNHATSRPCRGIATIARCSAITQSHSAAKATPRVPPAGASPAHAGLVAISTHITYKGQPEPPSSSLLLFPPPFHLTVRHRKLEPALPKPPARPPLPFTVPATPVRLVHGQARQNASPRPLGVSPPN